jgi:hypothetical protein
MKSLEFSNRQVGAERAVSFGPISSEDVQPLAASSPLDWETCIAVLHDLNNTFAAVLMNAQVMECKLPSYSRSKRYIHEIERGAQRGGALVKRLLTRFASQSEPPTAPNRTSLASSVPPVCNSVAMVATQEPPAPEAALDVAQPSGTYVAPVFEEKRIAHNEM